MENDDRKGFWTKTKEVLTYGYVLPDTTTQQGPGSVMSVGGTSPLPGVIPPPPSAALLLDARTAMGIHSVARAVNILSGSLAQLPLDVFKNGEELRAPKLIREPDARLTREQFIGLLVNNLAVYGNAYVRLHESVIDPQKTEWLEVLNPEFVRPALKDNGRKVYFYGDKEFADWQVSHLMVNVAFESGTSLVRGFYPIELNREELQGALDLRNYAARWFRNTGNVPVVLKVERELGDGEGSRIKAAYYASRAEGGADIDFMQLDPEKAQFTAVSQKTTTDVARMFGIPANLLLAEVNGTSTTYSNVQDNDRTFVQHTLMPFAKAIERFFSDLLANGQEVKFNFGGFLRGTTKDRYEAHKIALDSGFMTVNEVRELEDLPAQAGSNSTDGGTTDN